MIIVSDTTPLNYLILIDQAHILHELYDSVIIPQAVFDEMQRAETPAEVRTWIADRPAWLEVRPAQAPVTALKLSVGECEAIALALCTTTVRPNTGKKQVDKKPQDHYDETLATFSTLSPLLRIFL